MKEEWIGKNVKLLFLIKNSFLTYDAVIEDINDKFITFVDKYNIRYCISIGNLKEIEDRSFKKGGKRGI